MQTPALALFLSLACTSACTTFEVPPDDGGAAVTDDMIDAEAARLALLSRQFELGHGFAYEDGPHGQRVVPLDTSLLRTKLAFDASYRERLHRQYGPEDAPFATYAVIGNDNRTSVGSPRSYPYSKHVYIIMQRPHTELNSRRSTFYVCSGTFLDEDFVLTAAHCIYNRDESHFAYANEPRDTAPGYLTTQYGTDWGKGFVCLGGDIDNIGEFEDNCEFIETRWAPSDWVNASGNVVDTDYGLIKLQRANHAGGLGAGRWMAMSSIDSAGTYDNKTAVINGFPTLGPAGSNFVKQFVSVTDPTITSPSWQTADWEFYTPATLFHRSGDIDNSTTQHHLAYTADSSGGDSGAAVFYYADDATDYTGQAHYILGVHHGGLDSNGFNVGTTVHEFRDWVTTIMSAN